MPVTGTIKDIGDYWVDVEGRGDKEVFATKDVAGPPGWMVPGCNVVGWVSGIDNRSTGSHVALAYAEVRVPGKGSVATIELKAAADTKGNATPWKIRVRVMLMFLGP